MTVIGDNVMRVAITGATGFIGRRLCASFDEEGSKVLRISRRYGIDITDGGFFNKIREFRPEVIVHLAHSKQPPYDADIYGTLNVLDAARKLKVKQFVYTSSVAVYGFQHRIVLDEEAPLKATTKYGQAKIIGEHLCHDLFPNALIFRLFYVYDENSKLGVVSIPLLPPIVIGNKGTQRDYVHVDDAVSAIVTGIKSNWVGTFNVGTGIGVSLDSIAKARNPGRKPLHFGSSHSRIADILKISQKGWKPTHRLDF